MNLKNPWDLWSVQYGADEWSVKPFDFFIDKVQVWTTFDFHNLTKNFA